MSNISPELSIWCPTYNHEKFIARAIEGFLMQKVSFPIEIIIHDDASTDKTAEIICNYERKYPDLIIPIYQKENQFSKNVGHLTKICLHVARGKYIAFCEGDDYWTDPYKLQKQVDFLEENPEYGLTFGELTFIDEKENKMMSPEYFNNQRIKININGSCFAGYLSNAFIIHPLTVVLRNNLLQEVLSGQDKFYYDVWLFQRILFNTKIFKFDEIFGVYRNTPGSITKTRGFIKLITYSLYDNILYFSDKLKDHPEKTIVKSVLFKKWVWLIFLSKLDFFSRLKLLKVSFRIFPGIKPFFKMILSSKKLKYLLNSANM